MTHVLILILVALAAARDEIPGVPMVEGLSAGEAAAWTIGAMAALAGALALALSACGRRLDTSGSWMWIHVADGALSASRYAAVLFHVIAVLALGWLDAVREMLGGDLILIDDLVATLPPLLVFVLGWTLYYGIDRRLREASILRNLDSSDRTPRLPTRAQYAWEQTRHQMLIVLVPITLVLGWTDILDWAAGRVERRVGEAQWLGPLIGAAHLAGILVILVFIPLVLRLIWTTVPLGAGELRDRLEAMCRAHGVRCRDLLVWRTHSEMLNGAVVGIVPGLRYILLTDALLEQLPERQVEAVMAHELAHARRHHLPWLMGLMIAVISLAWAGASAGIEVVLPEWARVEDQPNAVASVVGFLVAAGVGFVAFGWVSRRFEEQADAFAVQHLSGMTRRAPGRDRLVISEDAARTMASALGAVSALNHIPPRRFSFRHGSIAGRQQRLCGLIGRRVVALPIDRAVAAIKLATALGLIALAALGWWAG